MPSSARTATGGQIDAFDELVRSGMGRHVDVALMKLCFADVIAGTRVRPLFRMYRATLSALQRDFPDVVFLHVTNPLTTGAGRDNVVRQRLNALMRAQYARSGRLFDLATAESTRTNGTRVGGRSHGARYYALNPAYAADSGHLNAAGSRVAADALLRTIATSVTN